MKTSTVVRLACVNALGFSASTVMPLWLGSIAKELGMPPWFAGAAVFAQLGGAAIFNLATPFLFRNVPPLNLARIAFAIAALAYLAAMTHSPYIFIVACLVCGSALGTVLNVTNRLMGSVDHVQKGYAIFVMLEIVVAVSLFLTSAGLIDRVGLFAVFPVVSVSAVLGALLLWKLPIAALIEGRPAMPGDPALRRGAVLTLASFALFFVGQAALNSFMPTIGIASGLSTLQASQLIGLSMPCGFVGALLARVVGERVRPVVPVMITVIVLACTALLLAAAPSRVMFIIGVVVLAITTLFSLPYFFAQLGSFDPNGRYTSFGPAMMLVGLALGPSSAVLLQANIGLAAVGCFSAVLLAVGGICFAAGTTRIRMLTSLRGAPSP
ncbi:MAG: hypothetical protein QOI59_1059 [Gammaproteobacteria bacterium]|jgi:hypothetical protein|nr:hypothetical protein [Gammaproteobacteria bacterium]